jgi:mono/diheme cytochrome c family protein
MKRLVFVSFLGALTLPAVLPAVAAEPTGKEVFDHYCAACHGAADGTGTMQLGRTRGKDKAFLTARKDLKGEYVEYVVRHGLRSMPPFVPSDLTDDKLKALSTFLAK